MSEKEFDRGKCFTFFASYRKQGERIKEILGPEKALEYYEAVIDYGLYAKPIDKELLLYIGDTLLETIDSSQEKRSRAFGENMTVTLSILELKRDHPEYNDYPILTIWENGDSIEKIEGGNVLKKIAEEINKL